MQTALKLTPDKVLKEYMQPSVFQVFTRLAREKQSVNLGQGFPNWSIPDFLGESFDQVIDQNIFSENYSFGCFNLLSALCTEYSPIFNQNLDPLKNVVVSNGGTTILSTICSYLSADDEVLVIEPYFSFYEPMVRFFRGKLRFVQMIQNKDNQFELDHEQIEAAVSASTKWIFLNSPHNPTGKVYSFDEYAIFAKLAEKYPQINFLSDEVYENVCFKEKSLPRFANLTGLWDRTVSIFSGGKTYSCTGWRIGWAIGHEKLIQGLKSTQHNTNTNPCSIVQEAMARAIPLGHNPYRGFENYYSYLKANFECNVRILEAALRDSGLGFEIFSPQGGYFLIADISKCVLKMPVYYMFSVESRASRENLKNVCLKSVREYQQFEGNLYLS